MTTVTRTTFPDGAPLDVVRQSRDSATGRYDFDGGFDRLCVCGHVFGVHGAESPAACLAVDADKIDPQRYPTPLPACDCERFAPLVARLTPSQREVLGVFDPPPADEDPAEGPSGWLSAGGVAGRRPGHARRALRGRITLCSLERARLLARRETSRGTQWRLTPLGVAVRAELVAAAVGTATATGRAAAR